MIDAIIVIEARPSGALSAALPDRLCRSLPTEEHSGPDRLEEDAGYLTALPDGATPRGRGKPASRAPARSPERRTLIVRLNGCWRSALGGTQPPPRGRSLKPAVP